MGTLKDLGQVFLEDAVTINKLVDSLNLNNEDIILEIGPGQGAITKKFVHKVYNTHLIEIDSALSIFLKKQKHPNTYIYNQNFLEWKWPLFPKPIKVISNLPYVYTFDILHKLIENQKQISKMVLVMIDKQADIIKNKNDQEGELIQSFFDIEDLFHIPKSSFRGFFKNVLKVESKCVVLKNKKA